MLGQEWNLADNAEPLNLSVPVTIAADESGVLTNRIPLATYERIWVVAYGTATTGNTVITLQAQEFAASSGGTGTNVGSSVSINDTGEVVIMDLDVSHKDAYLDITQSADSTGTSTAIGLFAFAFKKRELLTSDAYSYTMPTSPATALTDATYGPLTSA